MRDCCAHVMVPFFPRSEARATEGAGKGDHNMGARLTSLQVVTGLRGSRAPLYEFLSEAWGPQASESSIDDKIKTIDQIGF